MAERFSEIEKAAIGKRSLEERKAMAPVHDCHGSGKPDEIPWPGRWSVVDYRSNGAAVWNASSLFGRLLSPVRIPVGGRQCRCWKRERILDGSKLVKNVFFLIACPRVIARCH